ncbi:MAG TPA: hypothetical protein VK081_07380 [Planctomycetota bacterium]|nr:hypothetical protein [Planctomycetota bacterium]
MLPAVAVLLLASLAYAQQAENAPPAAPKSAPPAAPAPPPPAYTDRDAADAIARWKKVPAKAPLGERMAAIEELVRGTHASLVPVLDKVVRKDAAMSVRKKAAEALPWQPGKKTYAVVMALLGDEEIGKTPELAEPLVQGLRQIGYQPKDWDKLEKLFRAGYDARRIALQRAIVVLAGEQKEKEALALLLENFDEPMAADKHAADNPPQEYWEARWKAWKAWREEVKTAVQQITGQKFGTADEARAWLRTNAAKLGVKRF